MEDCIIIQEELDYLVEYSSINGMKYEVIHMELNNKNFFL